MTIRVGPLIPSYVTIDPSTGRIGANFTGIVHALALILDAAGSGQSATSVEWLDSLNNIVGEITNGITIVPRVSQARETIVKSIADAGVNDTLAAILAEVISPTGTSTIKKIIDTNGNSDFLQLGQTESLAVQAFEVTGIACPSGISNHIINLPSAWPTTHSLFGVISISGNLNNNQLSLLTRDVNNIGSGFVNVDNANASTQTVSLGCISFGN